MDYTSRTAKFWDIAYANKHVSYAREVFTINGLEEQQRYLFDKYKRYHLHDEASKIFVDEIEYLQSRINLSKLKS